MLNITIFSIIIICLGVILYIIYKKIPYLKKINPENQDLEKKKKHKLLEQRLKRKLSLGFKSIKENKIAQKFNNLKSQSKIKIINLKNKQKQYLSDIKKSKIKIDLKNDLDTENQMEKAERLLKQDKLKIAEKTLIQIIKKNPKKLRAYRLLAEVYFADKVFNHAEATLEHIIKLSAKLKQDKAADHLKLAQAKLELNKIAQALQSAKKAVSLEPMNPKTLHFMIKVCILAKQKKAAWRYYSKLKEINGESASLDEILEELKKM